MHVQNQIKRALTGDARGPRQGRGQFLQSLPASSVAGIASPASARAVRARPKRAGRGARSFGRAEQSDPELGINAENTFIYMRG